MDLANIEDVERFQPFLDAINKEQKMIFLEKETKKIYWKYIKQQNMKVTLISYEIHLKINLIIDINKYNTDTLYIPTSISSDTPLNLNLNIQTNAKKIKTENIPPYNEDGKNNEEKFNEEAHCGELKLEGFTPNSIEEVNVETFGGHLLDLSDNESLNTLKCSSYYQLKINNTKIKKLDCFASIIYAENSKLEEIEVRNLLKFKTLDVSIFASNSNLRTINKNDERIKLRKLDVENTPLKYINMSSQKKLEYLNIKNTKLPEEIKNELILSTINNKNSIFLKCDKEDQIIFYNKKNIKCSICKYDMNFRILYDNRIMSITEFKKIFIENLKDLDLEKTQIEYEKALGAYKKLTKNTELMILVMKLNEEKFYDENVINEIINKCSQKEINQRNIYGKSAICYINNLKTFKKLIESGYKIIKKDLPYLINNENQSIISFTENLIIKNSIMKEISQKIEKIKRHI